MRQRMICFSLLLVSAAGSKAQESKLTDTFKKESIDRINELVNDNYVFPDIARSTGEHVMKQLKEGKFDADTTPFLFAASLTRSCNQ